MKIPFLSVICFRLYSSENEKMIKVDHLTKYSLILPNALKSVSLWFGSTFILSKAPKLLLQSQFSQYSIDRQQTYIIICRVGIYRTFNLFYKQCKWLFWLRYLTHIKIIFFYWYKNLLLIVVNNETWNCKQCLKILHLFISEKAGMLEYACFNFEVNASL